MTDLEVQTAELVPSGTLFGTDNPGQVVERASAVARTLADVVRTQRLVVKIGQSEHVRVEGWTFLGSLLGVFPVVVWTREMLDGDDHFGWEARVEARTRAGDVVGAAEAQCTLAEKTWRGRDDYALRSMAQTRAVSKALRLPLGFVMQLAGFDPTPADEMPRDARAAEPHEQHPARATETVDDGLFPPADQPQPGAAVPRGMQIRTGAQAKKLNVLVGQLRPEHISTEDLWRSQLLDPDAHRDPDGTLHWSPLRDRLSRDQAHNLIDRLEKLAEKVRGSAFEMPPLTDMP